MDEYQDQDSTDETSSEESPILKEVRKVNRALEKENAKLKAKQAEVELAAQTQRADAAKEIVNTLGFPSLVDDVLQWVEGDITEQSVAEALEGRGIPLPEGTDQPIVEESQTQSASSVGQRVADAAAGVDGRSWDERIAATEDPAELTALMEEAGLVRSQM